MASKGYINADNSQMVSIGAIFTTTYHLKQLNQWPNLLASDVMNYSRLFASPREMEPFEDHPSTCGYLINLRNKPQQKQPGQFSAPIPVRIVSYCLQLSFDDEKFVLLLHVWKVDFLKSGHM